MDKLKPILAQKFWILSAVCLLLPLTGWWLATGAMALEYTTRTKAIDDAFKGIPQPGPNQKWTDRVLALNTEEEQMVKQTGEYLWTQQLALMVWPDIVKEGVEKVGFQGEIAAKTRGEYRYAYEQELIDLHQIVSPFDATTGEGLVDFPIELIPTLSWGTSPIPPSTVQMRDSQEDIWLYRTLLQGVANINEQFGCDSIVNSKIKQILMIELRGGTPGGAAAAAEAAGAAAGGMAGAEAGAMPGGAGAMPGAMPGGPGMGGGMSGLMGGGQSGGADTLKASFDPAEQFGSDEVAAASAEGGAGGADPMAAAPAGPGGAGSMPGGPGMTGMGMQGGGSTVKKRYIEETPRFKTRGFYMELVLDHRILPEFIAELSDSKWPLRVIRVQQVDLDLSEIGSSAVGVSGPGAMGGSARGAGSMPGAMPGAMRSASPARSPGVMAGAGVGRGVSPRPAGGLRAGGLEGGGVESTLDLQSAMTDPHLVNVALSGIITLYLPPEAAAAAQPGAEGAPAATPAAGDPTAATTPPAAGATASGTAPDPAAATDPAAVSPAAPAGAPAATTPPAADAKPAEAETAKPETPPAAPASTTTPAPATPPPAKPETPAAAGAKPEPGK